MNNIFIGSEANCWADVYWYERNGSEKSKRIMHWVNNKQKLNYVLNNYYRIISKRSERSSFVQYRGETEILCCLWREMRYCMRWIHVCVRVFVPPVRVCRVKGNCWWSGQYRWYYYRCTNRRRRHNIYWPIIRMPTVGR